MQLTYYHHYDRDADTHNYVLGIITDDTKFIDMYIDDVINPEFLDVVYSQKSLTVDVDAGTATFRKENKKYWYAYKKLKGKLNKAYVGTTQLLTELSICKAVEEVNTPKESTCSAVTQNDSVTALQESYIQGFNVGDRIRFRDGYKTNLKYELTIGIITDIDDIYIKVRWDGETDSDRYTKFHITQKQWWEKLDAIAVEDVNIAKAQKDCVTALQKSQFPKHLEAIEACTDEAVHKIGDRIDTSVPDEIPLDWNPNAEQWKRIAGTYQKSCDRAWEEVKILKAEIEKLKTIANPTTSLAGNGKNENHLQSNVIDCFEGLAIAQNEIIVLNKMLKDGDNFLRAANEKNHEKRVEIAQLKRNLKKLEEQLDTLEARNTELNQIVSGNVELVTTLETKVLTLQETLDERDSELHTTRQKHRNVGLAVAIAQERMQELQHTVEMQNDLIRSLQNDVFRLECEASKREDDVAGYAYMYDEHSNRIFAYQSLIEQYRALADGKTKKANPRYAYLLDFLADIDKIS